MECEFWFFFVATVAITTTNLRVQLRSYVATYPCLIRVLVHRYGSLPDSNDFTSGQGPGGWTAPYRDQRLSCLSGDVRAGGQ